MAKKKIALIGLILAAVAIVVAVVLLKMGSEEIDLELKGNALEIKGGDVNYAVETPIEISGVYTRRLMDSDEFEGKIVIGDYSIYLGGDNPIETGMNGQKVDRSIVEFSNSKFGAADIYRNETKLLGTLYFNEDLTAFVLCIHENQAWSVANGVAVVYPAQTREEAVELMNEMGKYARPLEGMK